MEGLRFKISYLVFLIKLIKKNYDLLLSEYKVQGDMMDDKFLSWAISEKKCILSQRR